MHVGFIVFVWICVVVMLLQSNGVFALCAKSVCVMSFNPSHEPCRANPDSHLQEEIWARVCWRLRGQHWFQGVGSWTGMVQALRKGCQIEDLHLASVPGR